MPGLKFFTPGKHTPSQVGIGADNVMPSFGRTMGAQFDEARKLGVTNSLLRMHYINKFSDRTGGQSGIKRGSLTGNFSPFAARNDPEAEETTPIEDVLFLNSMADNDNWLSRENALEMINSSGYSESDIPISNVGANRMVLQEILVQKDAQRRRQSIIARGAKGFGRNAAVMAVSLGASLTDPAEVAMGSIPFFGPARRANALKAAGSSLTKRAAVRAKFGMAEGALGALIVEPFPLFASQSDMLDYSIEDSVMNVVFGSLAGGGLHMGIGHLSDRMTLRRAEASLREIINQAKTPNGETPRMLDALPEEIRTNMMEAAFNASQQNRNIKVDELLAIADRANLQNNQSLRIAEMGVLIDVDAKGRVGIYDQNRKPLELSDIIESPDVSEAVKKIAKQSSDVEDFKKRIDKAETKLAEIDRRNVNDLRQVLNKQEAMPLSTYLESQGGLREIDAAGKAGINTGNRNKLFREKGMTKADAIKAAKKAGYPVSSKSFYKQLKKDIDGNRMFTDAAEKKLRDYNSQVKKDIASQVENMQRQQGNDLLAYNEGYRSNENLRSYVEGRSDEIANLKERIPDEHKVEDLDNALAEQMEYMKAIAEDDPNGLIDLESLDQQMKDIDNDANVQIEAQEKLAACLIGAGNG